MTETDKRMEKLRGGGIKEIVRAGADLPLLERSQGSERLRTCSVDLDSKNLGT